MCMVTRACVEYNRLRVPFKLDKTVFSAVLTSGNSLMQILRLKKTLCIMYVYGKPKNILLGQASDTCVIGSVRIYMG